MTVWVHLFLGKETSVRWLMPVVRSCRCVASEPYKKRTGRTRTSPEMFRTGSNLETEQDTWRIEYRAVAVFFISQMTACFDPPFR